MSASLLFAAGIGSVVGLLIASWIDTRELRKLRRELGLPDGK